jgi:hypothetical protein
MMVDTDVVFTASDNMLGRFERNGDGYRMRYDFQLRPGVSTAPRAPIPLEARMATMDDPKKAIVGAWRLACG